ncbi:MAG: DNA mismatch repair endonuclease MutL [Lachnospiraceae bacterium]|nr:DNA mismatch repair endonuclease MutL [Lachnospiraceae bacterium]
MSQISLLEKGTIDKIAAGEVIERPASVVKELCENAIDAGANAVTVEIREGGISFIRITDNGEGIPKEQVRTAFLRHATSKIRTVEDLLKIGTLGFRGEALSSISAVCQVELITKTAGALTGVRYCVEGSEEKEFEEIGAPDGSTFLVRNIFFNTPARKKFLKSAVTEAGYVSDLVEHLALSHPEISFKFISNGQTKLHTSGNNRLRDVIYSVFGREITANLIEVNAERDGISMYGFIGKPNINRGNRNFENYFINQRYVRSGIISKAVEEAYRSFLMLHRYPFTVFLLSIDPSLIDVNVHPTKMEVRFSDNQAVYQLVYDVIFAALSGKELIPKVRPLSEKEEQKEDREETAKARAEGKSFPEPFEKLRRELLSESKSPYQPKYSHDRPDARPYGAGRPADRPYAGERPAGRPYGDAVPQEEAGRHQGEVPARTERPQGAQGMRSVLSEALPDTEGRKAEQMELFSDGLLSKHNVKEHKLIGQVFGTYWIVEFRDQMYIIDQHAAHEKVMYEKLTKGLAEKTFTSQQISPPIILSLSMQEEETLEKYRGWFEEIGFSIEHFGGREYAVSAAPGNLYSIAERTLFTELLDTLQDWTGKPSPEVLKLRLATMACKAAVKGNTDLSFAEADELIRELLELENPYNCPHGRPTIIAMSKHDLEKKFKRIV